MATAHIGQIVVEQPGRPGFWLVKRVEVVHDDATMSVLSDDLEGRLSGIVGPVPVQGSYRVVIRSRRLMTRTWHGHVHRGLQLEEDALIRGARPGGSG